MATQRLYLSFGTTNIELNGAGSTRLVEYFVPATAMEEDGSVTERVQLMWEASYVGEDDPIGAINRWLRLAKAMQNQKASKQFVYLNYAETMTGTAWRSRVLDGHIIKHNEYGMWIKNGIKRFDLVVEHMPYWEGPLTAVPLTNSNGTDVTYPTGLRIYLCPDGSGASPAVKENWALIAADDIDGDLPAPVRYEIITSDDFVNQLVLGVYPNIMGLDQPTTNIELDDWTGGTAKVANAQASGGNYRSVTLGTSMADLLTRTGQYWNRNDFYGSWFRFFLRTFELPPNGTWFQVQLRSAHGIVLGETTPVQVDVLLMEGTYTNLFDLGSMKMLPLDQFMSSPVIEPTTLALRGYVAGGGTFYADALNLIPMDYFAWLKGGEDAEFGNPVWPMIEEWGDNEQSYSTGTFAYLDIIERLGSGIYLLPGFDNYLYTAVLPAKGTGGIRSMEVGFYADVALQYRPRRRNL